MPLFPISCQGFLSQTPYSVPTWRIYKYSDPFLWLAYFGPINFWSKRTTPVCLGHVRSSLFRCFFNSRERQIKYVMNRNRNEYQTGSCARHRNVNIICQGFHTAGVWYALTSTKNWWRKSSCGLYGTLNSYNTLLLPKG